MNDDVRVIYGEESNTLGIVGFVLALVGLFTGGILSPVGLVVSLIALGRHPRGFAWAGVIVGLIGSCGGVVLFLIFGAALFAALGVGVAAAVYAGLSDPARAEVTADMLVVATQVERTREESGYLPADLTGLDLDPEVLTDPWGNRYRYFLQEEEPGFNLISAGEDGLAESEDDIRLTDLDELWRDVHVDFEDFAESRVVENPDGTVDVDLGDGRVRVHVNERTNEVTLRLGDRTIHVDGDRVRTTGPDAPDSPDAPVLPDSPEIPDAPDAPGGPDGPADPGGPGDPEGPGSGGGG